MSTFENWLYTFIKNNNLDLNHAFTICSNEITTEITLNGVCELILKESPTSQIAIQTRLILIDSYGGDILRYFEFLAKEINTEVQTGDRPEITEAIKLLQRYGFIIKRKGS